VGVVLIPIDFDWSLLPGVGDSKQVSEKNRERIYTEAFKLDKAGQLSYAVEMGSASLIDKKGIAVVIRTLINKGLTKVSPTSRLELKNMNKNKRVVKKSSSRRDLVLNWGEVMVKLDGSLKAPDYCTHQETLIKGDAREQVIGLASIIAKVTRDRYMRRVAQLPAYVPYDFARHKGYGTVTHRRAIAEHGLSSEHRASYCKNIKFVG
jgi:ribonuclease HII